MTSPLRDHLREALVIVSDHEEARWREVVDRFTKTKLTIDGVLDRVAVSLGLDDGVRSQRLAEDMSTDDDAIPATAGQLLRVIAGCQLLALFDVSTRRTGPMEPVDAAALAVRCLHRHGGASPVLDELPSAADRWLMVRGRDLRQISYSNVAPGPLPKI